MYYFPRRPINRNAFYQRRSWNSDIPYYDDVVVHVNGDQCFSDGTGFGVPCSNGDGIAAVRNLSSYAGLNFVPLNSGVLMTYVTDNGFPAIFTGAPYQGGATPTAKVLVTSSSVAFSLAIVVFRSATIGWGNYGAVLGRSGTRPYLFGNYGTHWNDAPISVQRQNGVAQALGASLTSIATPMVLTIGPQAPSAVTPLSLGTQVDNAVFNAGLYIYEAIGYTSVLTAAQIAEVEAYLMDKYSIA